MYTYICRQINRQIDESTQIHPIPNKHHRVFPSFLLFYICNSLWLNLNLLSANGDDLFTVLRIWLPTSGFPSMGMPFSFCLGSDILLWATTASSTLYTLHTNTYTPHLVLPHLMSLELNCSGMEEKKREGKEERELPLFSKKNFLWDRTSLSAVKNVIPLSSGFHSCH